MSSQNFHLIHKIQMNIIYQDKERENASTKKDKERRTKEK